MAIAAPFVVALGEALAALAEATMVAVAGITGVAVVEEASRAREKARAESTAASAATEQCKKDDCEKKIRDMEQILTAAAPPKMHPKGLKQRFCEQRHGALPPGSAGWITHQAEIKKDQIRLKKIYIEAVMAGCPIPPKLREE